MKDTGSAVFDDDKFGWLQVEMRGSSVETTKRQQFEAVVKEIDVLDEMGGGAVDLQQRSATQESERNVEGQTEGNGGYGFVSYFGEAVRKLKAKDRRACITNEVRKEIGKEFKNLPPEKKCKYTCGSHRATPVYGGNPKFVSRCVPDRLATVASSLTVEQKAMVRAIGFGSLIEMKCGPLKRKLCEWLVDNVDTERSVLTVHGWDVELNAASFVQIMGISDGGLEVEVKGDMHEMAGYLDRFEASSKGIHIKKLDDILKSCHSDNDEFKVTFVLFSLGSVLCPPGGVHISSSLLFALKDVKRISSRNWASFCFDKLMQSITRYKEEKLGYVGGCLLYLQILYINSVQYHTLSRYTSKWPIVTWDANEIRGFMKWMDKLGGVGNDQVRLRDKVNHCSKEADGILSKIDEIDSEDNKFRSTGREPWVDGFYSRFDLLKELSLEILENIKGGGANLFRRFDEKSDSENDVAIGRLRCENVDGLAYCGNFRGGPATSKSTHQNATQWKTVRATNNVDKFVCPFGLELESPVAQTIGDDIIDFMALGNIPSGEECEQPTCMATTKANGNRSGWFRVGPYVIPRPVCDNEMKLIRYMMNEELDISEPLVQTKMNCLSRNEILSLSPKRCVNGQIISTKAEILSYKEREKGPDSPRFWFLPTYFAHMVLAQGIAVACLGRWKRLRECYMQDLSRCHKIVIPVNHEPSHWYVVIVDIKRCCAEIWNPMSSQLTTNFITGEASTILTVLDEILKDDIRLLFGGEFQFKSFNCTVGRRFPIGRYGFDCGLVVIRWMESIVKDAGEANTESLEDVAHHTFDSDEARKNLAIQLLFDGTNKVKDRILARAISFNNTTEADQRSRAMALEKKYRTGGRCSKRKGYGRRK